MEKDPNGKNQHESGAKLDDGKNRLGLCFAGFAFALRAVGLITTYGAKKYTPNGWKTVPDAEARYMDALLRHLLQHLSGERMDTESGHSHLAHAAWNVLALLEFSEHRK